MSDLEKSASPMAKEVELLREEQKEQSEVLASLAVKRNEKLDRLIELQEECNIVGFEHYTLAKCFKERTNKHRSRALYVTIGFAVTALAADYFIKGESSHIFTVIKMFGAI